MSTLQHLRRFAMVVFVGSTVVLSVQLINPSPVMVTIGDNTTEVAELGGYFQYRDVAVIAAAASLLGASGTYLLIDPDRQQSTTDTTEVASSTTNDSTLEPSGELLESRREEWESTAERLANNENEIYETLLEADGVLAQSDIVDETELSKATVSRTLDSLETKNLVERKRRGMGNVVLLQ